MILSTAEGFDGRYKEISASEIRNRIQIGEPLEYDHVIIKGEINLSQLNLPGKSTIISSPVRINDSIIEDAANFNNIIFNKSVNFNGSYFNNTADFDYSKFNDTADFGFSKFKRTARFYGAHFEGSAHFLHANFDGVAYFELSEFNNTADFGFSNFTRSARFSSSYFKGNGQFLRANFSGTADFGSSKFNSTANFLNSHFEGIASFRGANFCDTANFEGSDFNNIASFRIVSFDRNAKFARSQFKSTADFDSTNFTGAADFGLSKYYSDATFNRSIFMKDAIFASLIFYKNAHFSNSKFNSNATFRSSIFTKRIFSIGDDAFVFGNLELDGASIDSIDKFIRWNNIGHLKYDAQIYDVFLNSYKKWKLFNDFNDCYYAFRLELMESEKNIDGKLLSNMQWFLYGFGVKPLYPLGLSIAIILICGIIFFILNGIQKRDKPNIIYTDTYKKKSKTFYNSIYDTLNKKRDIDILTAVLISATFFSSGAINIFSTTPNDLSLVGISRYIAVFERFCGWAFFAIFLASLGIINSRMI
jgi:hypothetical protein